MAAALLGRVDAGHLGRTCLFANSENANGAAYTGVLTGTIGYLRPMGKGPYNRYRVYGKVSSNDVLSVIRVSTTSGEGVSSVHRVVSRIRFGPTGYGCEICVVSRIRVLAARTFGTLLGALRRPPRRIVFVLTAARIRGLPRAVLSHYRHFSFREVPPHTVTSELLCITGRRNIALDSDTTVLTTSITSNTLQSTLSLLSEYVTVDSRVSRSIIHDTTKLTEGACLFRLSGYMVGGGATGTLRVISELCNRSGSVTELYSRLLSRFEALVLVGSMGGPESVIVVTSSRFRRTRARSSCLSLTSVICCVSILSGTCRGVNEKANSEARLRVTIMGLSSTRLSNAVRTLATEMATLRGTIGGKVGIGCIPRRIRAMPRSIRDRAPGPRIRGTRPRGSRRAGPISRRVGSRPMVPAPPIRVPAPGRPIRPVRRRPISTRRGPGGATRERDISLSTVCGGTRPFPS